VLLSDACADYVSHITHERRLARSTTVTGYASYLRQFLRWMEANGYPEPTLNDLSTPVLRRYLYYLSGEGLRPRTIRGRFHPITGLGAFLVENGILETNPTKALTMPKKDAARRTMVTEEEAFALLDACERLPNARKIALSRAVFAVFIFAGLRRSELLDLRVGDVNLSEKCLLVRNGKGNKSRMVYVGETCLTAIREWLTIRPQNVSHDYLFLSDRTRRLAELGLVKLFDAVKRCAGYAERAHIQPHSIRHQFASRLLAKGADIRSIQSALGHAHLSTTAIYLHLNEQQAKQVADLAEQRNASEPTGKILHLPQTERERGRLRRRAC
jgi:site-specific recombinase XerD